MASKAEYLKKRKVRKLSDMINRKFDPGQGNPKTVNPNKKKSVVPREPDYLSEAVQKLAYKLGLTDQPSAQSVREEAYKTKKKGGLKTNTGRPKPGRGISTVNKPSGEPEKRQLEKPKGQPYGMTYLQKPKGQPYGMNVTPPGGPPSGKPSATATATAGTGTSTGAAEKMTNFERLKARQYEREGYGGRVMTRKKATEQIMKERQYKSPLAGLFKRKGK
jgi:hypothetical protein